MNTETAHILNNLNADFYAKVASSFSGTRQVAWSGWERCMALVRALDESWCEDSGNAIVSDSPVPADGAAMGDTPVPADGVAAFDTPVPAAMTSDSPAPNPSSPDSPLPVVLDVAAGNLRFEQFAEASTKNVRFVALDNCADLGYLGFGESVARTTTYACDVVGDLLQSRAAGQPSCLSQHVRDALALAGCAAASLTVSFAFIHHIPGFANRIAFLRSLASVTRPGGYVIVSLWRFMDCPDLAAKALPTLPQQLGAQPLDLDEGDYFIGWQNMENVFRYCHHFAESEIRAIIEQVSDFLECVDVYQADGKTGNLNTYVIWRVNAQITE